MNKLKKQFQKLKKESGSHSPSLLTIKKRIPEIDIKVDACFLSNPYATDLFLSKFKSELIQTNKFRDALEFYPSQNTIIAETLSEHLNVDKEQIFVGNGATEVIQAIFHNFIEESVMINVPTFSPYYEFAKKAKVVYNKLTKENNFNLNIEEFCQKAKKHNVNSVVIINPNNPDGGYIKHKDMLKLFDGLKFVNNVIVDESFIHFAYEDKEYKMQSCVDQIKNYKNLIIIKSMSKDFGIAGIRAGYAVMQSDKVSSLLNDGYLWNLNGLAEYFFNLYTDEKFNEEYEKVRIKYIKETSSFINEMKKIKNIKVYNSKANFILIELETIQDSMDLVVDMLVEDGIYLRSCNDKVGLGNNFIRMASRNREQNEIILNSFKKRFGVKND